MSVAMSEFERLAADLSAARATLTKRAQTANAAVAAVRNRHRETLTEAVGAARAAEQALLEAIKKNPGVFKKPKSRTLSDVKFGFQKKRGRIEIADANKTIDLILMLFPKQSTTLLKSKVSVDKTALNNLSAGELRKIGVTIEADFDEAFVKPAETSIDKLVAALLEAD